MFLVDNLLVGPGQAALFVFKELARKAQEDWLNDDAVKQELQEIYALVEAGKISTQDFEARECRLLERLEQIARARYHDKWTQEDGTVIEAETVVQSIDTALSEAPRLIEASPVVEPAVVVEQPSVLPAPPRIETPPRAETPPRIETPPVIERPEAMITPPLQPPVVPPPPQPLPAAPAPASLSITQVVQATSRALALLNLKLSVITSVAPEDGGWRVTAELVERRGVPDTNDLIGVYDVRLDAAGTVTRYERTRMRRRGDLGR